MFLTLFLFFPATKKSVRHVKLGVFSWLGTFFGFCILLSLVLLVKDLSIEAGRSHINVLKLFLL